MPEGDGLQAVRKCRNINAALQFAEKLFFRSFRTKKPSQVIESSFVEMTEITKLVPFSANCLAAEGLRLDLIGTSSRIPDSARASHSAAGMPGLPRHTPIAC
jgi:hypothetical protein